jgi:hypothetical protein
VELLPALGLPGNTSSYLLGNNECNDDRDPPRNAKVLRDGCKVPPYLARQGAHSGRDSEYMAGRAQYMALSPTVTACSTWFASLNQCTLAAQQM